MSLSSNLKPHSCRWAWAHQHRSPHQRERRVRRVPQHPPPLLSHQGATPNEVWGDQLRRPLNTVYRPPERLPAKGRIEAIRFIRSNRRLDLFGKKIIRTVALRQGRAGQGSGCFLRSESQNPSGRSVSGILRVEAKPTSRSITSLTATQTRGDLTAGPTTHRNGTHPGPRRKSCKHRTHLRQFWISRWRAGGQCHLPRRQRASIFSTGTCSAWPRLAFGSATRWRPTGRCFCDWLR
jgi:hypothetical protein